MACKVQKAVCIFFWKKPLRRKKTNKECTGQISNNPAWVCCMYLFSSAPCPVIGKRKTTQILLPSLFSKPISECLDVPFNLYLWLHFKWGLALAVPSLDRSLLARGSWPTWVLQWSYCWAVCNSQISEVRLFWWAIRGWAWVKQNKSSLVLLSNSSRKSSRCFFGIWTEVCKTFL